MVTTKDAGPPELLLQGKVAREHLERMQRYCEQLRRRGDKAVEKNRLAGITCDLELDRIWIDQAYGDTPPELLEACEVVIAAVQRELARLAPGPLTPETAYELVTAESWALHVLVDTCWHRGAKQKHVGLSDGRPLAVCRSTMTGREVIRPIGSIKVHGKGCLRIFESTTRASGRMWPQLCPDCRPRNGKRNPPRDAERAAKARGDEIAALRASTVAPRDR